MFRQASSRNHRSKGLKVKHFLQICLLVAVTVWLLYQVKHSYDKKSALDKSDAKKLENFQSKQEILKLGRKDIDQKEELSSAIHMKHRVEDENEDEDEESKPEENEAEGGVGDDEIDKHDQEKIATESAHPEDFGDEEENKVREEEENKEREEKQEEENKGKEEEDNKEKEEEDNKEKEEKEEERKDKEPKVEEEGIKEKEEKEESQESKENSHEAREAQYHGDNASSAVSKERVISEGGREDSVKSEEEHGVNSDKNDVEIDNRTNGTMDFSTKQIENISTPILQTTENPAVNATELEKDSEISLSNIENGTLTNSTAENIEKVGEISLFKMENETPTNLTLGNEEKHGGVGLPKSENETYLNSTAKSSDQISVENNLAESSKEDISSFMQNETSHLDQNITLKTETASNQELHSQTVLLEQIEKSNITADEAEKQTDSPNSNTLLGEKQSVDSNSPNEFGESKDNLMSSKPNENSEAVRIETNGTNLSSVTEEVREAFMDPGTLPDTKSESKNAEGVAAE